MQGEPKQCDAPATATLLFMGKMETMISQIEKSLRENSEEHKLIMEKLDKMDDKYVRQSDFALWRWILIVGIFLSIAMGSVKFIFK